MHSEHNSKICLGDCYTGLYFFSNIPKQKEIIQSIENYNNFSKHAINSCVLYVASKPKKLKNAALLIVDAKHHLEPLLALSSAWTTKVGFIFAVPIYTYALAENKNASLLNKPTAPKFIRIADWNRRSDKSLSNNDIALLKLISTVTSDLEIICLCPNSFDRNKNKKNVETYIFSFSKCWVSNIKARRTSTQRKPYHFLLSHVAETYRSDLSYLLLRITRLKSILDMKEVKTKLTNLIKSRVRGVLLAIKERLDDLQKRGVHITLDVAKIPNMFTEIDGAYKAIEHLSQTLTVLEQVVLTRSMGGFFFRTGVEIADSYFQLLALRALDNIILDATSCLRGTKNYVYGKKPGTVAIGGQTFRPLHKDLRELVGQYTDVYADENLIITDRHFDLASYGVIECYEIPIRYLLRAGSWPLIIHPIVETNEMRLGELGQYKQVRIALDLLKWWFKHSGKQLPEQLQMIDEEWAHQTRRFPQVPLTEIPEIKLRILPSKINSDIAKLLSSSFDVLQDIVCTRITGPAYVFALSRFGLRGKLANLRRQKPLEENSIDEGLLSHPIGRLSLCISTLKAEGLITSAVSDILPTHYSLPRLDSQILKNIDDLFVVKPFKKKDETIVQNIIAELTQGYIIKERPLLLLNALWYAVIKGKPYLNEPALLLSLLETNK